MLEKRFYYNSLGTAHVEFQDPAYKDLEMFFSDDIGSNLKYARELVKRTCSLMSGSSEEFSGVGNSHFLRLNSEGAYVECDLFHAYPPVNLSLEEFRDLVQDWINFIETSSVSDSK